MKSYCRKAFSVTLLVLALASPAFAGWIHADATPPPPPPPTTITTEGVTQTEAESTSETADIVTEQALNLLESLLSLF